MRPEQADQLKQAIIKRAIELGMDPDHKQTCSPGIRALAQMHRVVAGNPTLLQAFEDDLLVHDFWILASPDAPEQFVWTVRPSGTNLYFSGQGEGTRLRRQLELEPQSIAYTFSENKLERVLNLDYAVNLLSQPTTKAA